MAKKTKIPQYAWIVLVIAVVIGFLAMTSGGSESLAKFYATQSSVNMAKYGGVTTTAVPGTSIACTGLTGVSMPVTGKITLPNGNVPTGQCVFWPSTGILICPGAAM